MATRDRATAVHDDGEDGADGEGGHPAAASREGHGEAKEEGACERKAFPTGNVGVFNLVTAGTLC